MIHFPVTALVGFLVVFLPSTLGRIDDALMSHLIKIGASVKKTRPHLDLSQFGRIVGGTDADPTLYPFFSFIAIDKTFDDGSTGTDFCGGSLIAVDVVMTAAHCFLEGNVELINVIVNNTSLDQTGYEYVQEVETYRVNPDFDPVSYDNDVAILLLPNPVTEVTPIAINKDINLPVDGEDLYVVGMGLLEEDGSFPEKLQVAIVQAVNSLECAELYSIDTNETIDGELQICAAAPGRDACSADSGAPLILDLGTSFLQVGSVSFGFGCADPAYPGVYARMSAVYDFVSDALCELSQSSPAECGGTSPIASEPPDTPAPATLAPLEPPETEPVSPPFPLPVAKPVKPPVETSKPSPTEYHYPSHSGKKKKSSKGMGKGATMGMMMHIEYPDGKGKGEGMKMVMGKGKGSGPGEEKGNGMGHLEGKGKRMGMRSAEGKGKGKGVEDEKDMEHGPGKGKALAEEEEGTNGEGHGKKGPIQDDDDYFGLNK